MEVSEQEFRDIQRLVHRLCGLVLTDDKTFPVIFCRNVQIYFDAPSRSRLCNQFHQLLVPGGFMILGAAENLLGITTPFKSEQLGVTTVYRVASESSPR